MELMDSMMQTQMEASTNEYERMSDEIAELRAALKRADEQNFALAAGQCVVEGGLTNDERGHQYCKLSVYRSVSQAIEPARKALTPMPTDESSRQWFFDCDGLYIDVEHLNGEVSIFVRARSDNSVAWKELVEKSAQVEQESSIVEIGEVRHFAQPYPNLEPAHVEVFFNSKPPTHGTKVYVKSATRGE